MARIVPRSKAPGADFFGVKEFCFIVRSDLGCYVRSTSFHRDFNPQVFRLHTSCQGGDHYLANEDLQLYIIKGDNYRRVSNMTTDDCATVFSLHPNCRGGDHYLSTSGHFYIIFQAKGVYRRVTDMNTDANAIEYTLHPDCRNGLYYWGARGYYYFVKPHDEWGVQYFTCTNLHENTDADTCSFHGSVVPFIPGGLGIIQGAAFGQWEAIKTISNDSNIPIVWNKKITKKVGYNKQTMTSIEHNWKINMGATYLPGTLTEAIAKYQFSISLEYGGKAVNTEQETWSEATEVEESINVTLLPKSQLYIWQYQLGFGKETILFCRDMKFTNDSTPPAVIPLSLSNK